MAHRRPRRASRAIADAVGGAELVLADGHHRFETACNYRDERARRGHDDPGADAIMTLVVELAPDELVRARHPPAARPASATVDLRAALAGPFMVTPPGPTCPRASPRSRPPCATSGGLGLVDRDGLALLLPTAELEARMAELPVELRDVDSARVRRRRAPAPSPGVTLAYRNDARDRRRPGREGRRRRRGPAAAGAGRHHPRRGGRRPPHAGEDDVLRARSRAPGMVFRSLDD